MSAHQTAGQAAEQAGVVVRPPQGHELVGFTWEYRDRSFGLVRPDESVSHRYDPTRMRPVYAPLRNLPRRSS